MSPGQGHLSVAEEITNDKLLCFRPPNRTGSPERLTSHGSTVQGAGTIGMASLLSLVMRNWPD